MMNAIDLFSGAGGFVIGLQNSGFNVLLTNEISPVFAKTHKLNFPDVPVLEKDIKDLTE